MIERHLITANGNSRIVIGQHLLTQLASFIPRERSLLFVDSALTDQVAQELPNWQVVSCLSGESAKSLPQVDSQYKKLLAQGAERGTILVGIGGGALLDLVGFVAATFLRGLECVFVPSTLLAQVDASIGGKNGINFSGYKNVIGTIRQPGLVLCDVSLLASLPPEEFLSGLAEVVKHGAIADREILDLLAANQSRLLERDSALLTTLIDASLAVKQSIVEQDPLENGTRRVLNFGHTVGHALEHLLPIKHGHAVAIGMCVAAHISVNRGLLRQSEARALIELLNCLGLPTTLAAAVPDILEGMAHDKKRNSDRIHTVLLTSLGTATTEQLSFREWEDALTRFTGKEVWEV